MKPEETIDFPIRWAWHKISRLYNIEAQKHGFTMSIGYVLLNIDRDKGTPSTKLGPLMGMESRSLTRTLKSMEDLGFIERKPDEFDKRKVRIFLTDLGEKKRKISRDTVLRFNEAIHSALNDKELNQMLSTMNKINHLLDNEDIFQLETETLRG
jgi:DNA-binding MarR family transcriptional regulator